MDENRTAGGEPPADTGEPLGAIRFHNGDELRFRWVTDGGGDPYLSVWLWHLWREDGRWRPDGRRGLRVHPREVVLWQRALGRAQRRATRWRAELDAELTERAAHAAADKHGPAAA